MRILIVEDEILLARKLQKLILALRPDAQVEGMVHGVSETVAWLTTHQEPDLIFMDIELNDGQSFDIFTQVTVHAPVIFTTAYDEYAIQAFKVNSIDYLLKPIRQESLKTAIEKYERLHTSRNSPANVDAILEAIQLIRTPPTQIRDRFLVKTGQKMIPVDIADIAYFFSESGLSFIYTRNNQKYPLDYTLDELEHMVSATDFIRANRQYILSKSSIRAIHQWFNGKIKVDLQPDPGKEVIVSREKAATFKSWLGA